MNWQRDDWKTAVRSRGLLQAVDSDGVSPALRTKALVAAPSDYHAFVLEVPRVPSDEMEALLRYQLRTEYPGPVNSLCLSYHRLADGAVLVLAMERSILDEYRRVADRARIYTVETLALVANSWVQATIEAAGWRLELRRFPFVRLVEHKKLEDGSSDDGVTLAELATGRVPRRLEDFRMRRVSCGLRRGMRVGAAALACLAFAGILIRRDVLAVRAADELQSALYQSLLEEMEDATAALSRVKELESTLAAMPEPADPSPFEVLVALAAVADGGVELSDLTIQGAELTLSGTSPDPLQFADKLSRDVRFDSVQLVRVEPRGSAPGKSWRRRFSLRGMFAP